MTDDSLVVWHGGGVVGELYLGVDGRSIGFNYNKAWMDSGLPVSTSLPLAEASFPAQLGKAHLWFGNLLPEEGSRAALVKRLGVADDDFALLRALGGDCAGALTILPVGVQPDTSGSRVLADNKSLMAWASGRERYSLIDPEALSTTRLSLAGAQDKIPVILGENDAIYLPQGVTPSSHILKFAEKPGLVFNELCMNTLAQEIGLPCPDTRLLRVGKQVMLAVERYDRKLLNGTRLRIHQEDFCQALGLPRSRKYQSDGGPSLLECAMLLRSTSKIPARAIQQLMRWQIFNVLAGNSDGHAKNLSLLQDDSGNWSLAPAYDLVCTRVMPFDATLAFAVGEQFNPQQVIKRDWQRMAKDIGVAPPFLLKEVSMLAGALQSKLAGQEYQDCLFERGLSASEWEKTQHVRRYITQQCAKTLKLFA